MEIIKDLPNVVMDEVRTPNHVSLGVLRLECHEDGTVAATLEDSRPWNFTSLANFMEGKDGNDDLRFIISQRDRERVGFILARKLIEQKKKK